LAASPGEASVQFGRRGWQDKDQDSVVEGLPDLSRALHIDVEDDDSATLGPLTHPSARSPIPVAMDRSPLDQLAGLDHLVEFGVSHEVVVLARPLLLPLRARR